MVFALPHEEAPNGWYQPQSALLPTAPPDVTLTLLGNTTTDSLREALAPFLEQLPTPFAPPTPERVDHEPRGPPPGPAPITWSGEYYIEAPMGENPQDHQSASDNVQHFDISDETSDEPEVQPF